MFDRNDLVSAGVFTRTHGVRGEIILRLQDRDAEDIPEMEWVFVEVDGLPVPFFIRHAYCIREDKMILRLDTVETEAQARKLTGCRLFLAPVKRSGKKSEKTIFAGIKGYGVWDENLGNLGIADEIIAVAGNPLLRVISEEREFLIPAHPDIILQISHKKKHIRVRAPEGLIEL
jgi:16S rRNA processing protein RimM